MTPDQIRDYENPGIFKHVDRTPETPMPDRYTRHTEDADSQTNSCKSKPVPRLSGAAWAWVAMTALVGLYLVWKHLS